SVSAGLKLDLALRQLIVRGVPLIETGRSARGRKRMGIRSVQRAMNVLQELNLQPINTIARLHARTKLPKPTLVRILQTLEEAGYVENDARQGGYQVTALVTSLSVPASTRSPWWWRPAAPGRSRSRESTS